MGTWAQNKTQGGLPVRVAITLVKSWRLGRVTEIALELEGLEMGSRGYPGAAQEKGEQNLVQAERA